MDKEDIAFKKMAMLMKAVTEANEQEDTLEELKAAAFEVLLLNPGCEYSDWAKILVEKYGMELIDVFGTDGERIISSLRKLWTQSYHDTRSGLTRTYEKWAQAFATEESVKMYLDISESQR